MVCFILDSFSCYLSSTLILFLCWLIISESYQSILIKNFSFFPFRNFTWEYFISFILHLIMLMLPSTYISMWNLFVKSVLPSLSVKLILFSNIWICFFNWTTLLLIRDYIFQSLCMCGYFGFDDKKFNFLLWYADVCMCVHVYITLNSVWFILALK